MSDPNIPALVITFLILIFSLTIHEAAHAGRPVSLATIRQTSRPRVRCSGVHIDPIGTLLLPLVALASGSGMIFGWAKPTPIGIRNFRHPRRDSVLVTGAGPASNLIIAVIATLVFRQSEGFVQLIALEALSLNVLLAVFNMLPIPQLDGGQILMALLPPRIAISLAFCISMDSSSCSRSSSRVC